MPVLYAAVLAILAVLMLLSARERMYCDKPIPFILKPIRKSAVYLYRRIRKWSKRWKLNQYGIPGSEAVQKNLSLLDSSMGTDRRVAFYYIDKIQNLLLFAVLAAVLSLAAWYSAGESGWISSDGSIKRPDYGQNVFEITVSATNALDEDLDYGEYTVEISARAYTQEQTDILAEELLTKLPDMITGDNESLSTVSESLNLIEEAEGYPFTISWTSNCPALVASDGTVYADADIAEDGEEVELKAVLSYMDRTYEGTYSLIVFPLKMSEEEQIALSILEALSDGDAETASEEFYYLPAEIDGISLNWTENVEDSSMMLFVLIMVSGFAVFLLSDRDLRRKRERREQQMAMDYPQIISKLVLFLGAGMSVRNSFARLGEDYLERYRKGGEKRYVYEEILLVCRELDSGISESTAYSHFGNRCQIRQYTRLCSLLSQNLKKGNHALLQALQEEADLAFEERKSLARKMGEEAGTRLLLPMTIMLAVTLVIIMIPAYLSFSL